jgi:putative ABC transport system permease protein
VLAMSRQMNLIEKKELGYSKDNIIALEVKDETIQKNYEPLKNEIIQYPGIIDATSSRDLPTSIGSSAEPFWEGQLEGQSIPFERLYVDYGFIDFYNIEIANGRNFVRESGTDADQGFIINETAARLMSMEEPVGKRFGFGDKEGFIIGIVKDFHFESLHNAIRPLAIEINPWGHRYISIKINPDDTVNTLAFIKKKWGKFSPGFPYSYTFVEDIIHEQYVYEQKLFTAIKTSTMLALFLSCIGLGGLASLSARSKTKEIGIRKVFGASVTGMTTLFSKQFIKVVMISCFIAWPVAYYFMNKWLQNFAYRVPLSIWIFLLSGFAALVIALLTVSYQTIKAATANPVDSLRYE